MPHNSGSVDKLASYYLMGALIFRTLKYDYATVVASVQSLHTYVTIIFNLEKSKKYCS